MKVGFQCSSFDLLHAGHITMLKEEKRLCDYLIVALQVDPTIDRPGVKNKPIQSVYERYVQLQACKYVDEILVYETEYDLLQLLMTQKIDIRFLSEEYLNRDFTGKQYCIQNGIEIHYHKRQHNYSSSELRERVYNLEKKKLEDHELLTVKTDIPQHSPELVKHHKNEI
jgi:glycerol-3-phosphate cytidylyltransferase